MKRQIIFKYKDYALLKKSLYERQDLESAVYACYKESTTENSHKILVNKILVPKKRDYYTRNPTRVAFAPEFTEKALRLCLKHRYHLLDIHTHPWSHDVSFSSIDDQEAIHTKIPYFKQYLEGTKISFIVFGESSEIAQARMWEIESDMLQPIGKIVIL